MTDFVLEIYKKKSSESGFYPIIRYAEFLKQPLTLGMFIPCDENGKPLEEPPKITHFDPTEPVPDYVEQEFYDYEEAKEKVLFESYQLIYRFQKWKSTLITKNKDGLGQFDIYDYKTIEDLIPLNLTLTPNAIKQLGL